MKTIMGRIACAWLLALTSAAAGQAIELSADELSAADELIGRMAGHFKPIPVNVDAKVRPYELPVDLDRLSNPKFRINLQPFRNKRTAEEGEKLLSRNGLAVFPDKTHDDVPAFYASVASANVPIFITSDSLLHLYHVQFDETLRDLEERHLTADVLAICQAVQAEAVKMHRSAAGEVKDAAALLAGYASVPVALLGQTGLASEAAAAMKEVSSWAADPDWRRREEFVAKYAEVLKALQTEQGLGSQRYGLNVDEVTKALSKYIARHPVTGEEKEKHIPAFVAEQVTKELDLIAGGAGFAESPLFTYKEDYSQYIPRGHYTRSRKLKQYFRATMWLGRMTFLIRGRSAAAGVDGLVPLAEAQRQTRAACLLAGIMDRKLPDGRTIAQAWDRLYAVTAFYAGTADDLTPHDYRKAMRQMLGANPTGAMLAEQIKLFDIRVALSKMRRPAIYSGLGLAELPPVTIADEKDLAKALVETQGLRLLGQRYVPDSYAMVQLVYPTVGAFNGQGEPFTLGRTGAGAIRAFPRGLDVMAVLGSERAGHWLAALGDDAYARYYDVLRELRAEMADLPETDWHRNLYWAWLSALRTMLKPAEEGYPAFMRTEAWTDKQLSAALASWAQLRHDTLLYVKPSYTKPGNGGSSRSKMVEGYVEPAPELYARLLEVTKMTRRGLEEMKLLDAAAMARVRALEDVLNRLLTISINELADRKLTEDDYAFIREFGKRLGETAAGTDKRGLETTIVADVHTDANSRRVLTEATGRLDLMVVIYPMPDGGLVAGVGPVLSHYEFLQPMAERLTDAAWRKMLEGPQAPPPPAWRKGFTVGR